MTVGCINEDNLQKNQHNKVILWIWSVKYPKFINQPFKALIVLFAELSEKFVPPVNSFLKSDTFLGVFLADKHFVLESSDSYGQHGN